MSNTFTCDRLIYTIEVVKHINYKNVKLEFWFNFQ